MSKPSDERYTQTKDFQVWNDEFKFTLDACATAESAKCPKFYTKEQNGLAQNWAGERVFCNPPWSDIEPWVEKAIETVNSAPGQLVVMLLPARTSSSWWHKFVEPYRDQNPIVPAVEGWSLTTRFLKGRNRFGSPGDPEGENAGSPFFWCVLLVFQS